MKLFSIFVLLSLLGLVIMAPVENQETGVVDSDPIFRTDGETETIVEKRCGGDKNKKKKNKKNKNRQ